RTPASTRAARSCVRSTSSRRGLRGLGHASRSDTRHHRSSCARRRTGGDRSWFDKLTTSRVSCGSLAHRWLVEEFMRLSRFVTLVLATAFTVSLNAAPGQRRGGAQDAPPTTPAIQLTSTPAIDKYKADVGLEVDGMREDIQKMNDTVFSFAEPGFQEV